MMYTLSNQELLLQCITLKNKATLQIVPIKNCLPFWVYSSYAHLGFLTKIKSCAVWSSSPFFWLIPLFHQPQNYGVFHMNAHRPGISVNGKGYKSEILSKRTWKFYPDTMQGFYQVFPGSAAVETFFPRDSTSAADWSSSGWRHQPGMGSPGLTLFQWKLCKPGKYTGTRLGGNHFLPCQEPRSNLGFWWKSGIASC